MVIKSSSAATCVSIYLSSFYDIQTNILIEHTLVMQALELQSVHISIIQII